ncbi:GNAT family N-acetyltransferase [Streptomyces indicus]|uniref:GNAT family N-acetyltransferase n=1 Tax=Streptomyces indicus TaxID=417292 RepID=UPI001FE255B1|nr:GNAT family N-acetyltransferase [Streptomyces indicus]
MRASFVAAQEEDIAAGDLTGALDRELPVYGADWHTPEGFARYVNDVREEALEEGRRPAGFVPATWYWFVAGDTYLGRIQLRHRLTSQLLAYGGHIGYRVRPSARRQGHATAMLRAVLPHAHRLGLDRVLVTCDHDNTGSRKVIEANGGVLEDERDGKLRYWVATQPRIRDAS